MGELKKQFRPEFINRIDEIIVFHKLNDEDIRKIIDIMLNDLIKRLNKQDISIQIEDGVKEKILKEGTNTSYGARPLRRAIQTMLEDKIAEAILDKKIEANKMAIVSIDEQNEIVVK